MQGVCWHREAVGDSGCDPAADDSLLAGLTSPKKRACHSSRGTVKGGISGGFARQSH
jgi:hypothetical protein